MAKTEGNDYWCGGISVLPSSKRMLELSETPSTEALMALAKNLDLPCEDSETVDFLRMALRTTGNELRASELQWRADRAKARCTESSHD